MGRSELLGWINETLGTRFSRIEDTANGATACQLMDALHPGSVPMKKVDCNAKNEYDMINNYKVLQDVFNKLNVEKYIEVNKLIKAKPLDNTEFMQWFKMYHDQVTGGQPILDYDGPGRRAHSKTGDIKGAPAPQPGAKAQQSMRQMATPTGAGSMPRRGPSITARPTAGSAATSPTAPSHNNKAVADLSAHLNDVSLRADGLEKEKEFYYSKLRDIELLCQTPTICDIPIIQRVEAILYAATQAEGRQALTDAQQDFAGGVFLDVEGGAQEEEQGAPVE